MEAPDYVTFGMGVLYVAAGLGLALGGVSLFLAGGIAYFGIAICALAVYR